LSYSFKDIFSDIKRYKKEFVLANIVAVLAVLVSIPAPLLMPLLVDEVLLNKPAFLVENIDSILGTKSEAYVYVLVVLCIVILMRFLFFILNFFQVKLFTIISKNITYKIRKDLINHLSKVSLKEFEFLGTGKISSLLMIDVDTIDNFLGSVVSRLIISVLTIIGVSTILLMIHWKLALFILLVNPFVILLTTKIARKISQLKKEENKTYALFNEALSETLDVFVQIKSLNKEKKFFEQIIKKADTLKDRSCEFTYKSDGATKFSYLVFLSGFELFRGASILVVAYSDLTIGLMLAIFGYLWVMMSPIQEVLNMQYAYHNAKAALQRINHIFTLEVESVPKNRLNPFKNSITNSIEVKNLYFSYDNEKDVLRDITLKIQRGKKIAIIGSSGSGKTTLAQLLVGLYPFDRGDILFDGCSVKEIGLDLVRQNVYLVLQNPQLINDTILKNLTFSEKFEESRLRYALKVAQLEEFIESLKDGLETKIGKNGIRLSGGQRQRLSIARMVLQDPKVVILDESTSALDVHTESKLFYELENYLKDKTTIIIAHRLSTIRKADFIYVLESGQIVESGVPDELMKLEGVFYNYVNRSI